MLLDGEQRSQPWVCLSVRGPAPVCSVRRAVFHAALSPSATRATVRCPPRSLLVLQPDFVTLGVAACRGTATADHASLCRILLILPWSLAAAFPTIPLQRRNFRLT
jgi:hypothetical protein